MKIELKTSTLAAVALFKGVKDIRYYLNGVYIETGPAGARIVATDGHTMAIAKIDGAFPVASIIVPDQLIERVKPKKRGAGFVEFEFSEGARDAENLRKITLRFDGMESSATEVNGEFPEFRRVIPKKITNELAYFDPVYLARAQKAATILTGCDGYPYPVYCNGATGTGVQMVGDDFMALVMPVRIDAPDVTVPSWAGATLETEDTPAAEPEVV